MTTLTAHAGVIPPSKTRLIFGREPAAWIAVVDVTLVLIASFGLPLTSGQTGAVIAVLTALGGLFTTWAVQPIAPALFVTAAKVAVALVTAFGLNLDAGQQGAILSAATVVLTLILRNQVTPPVTDPTAPVVVPTPPLLPPTLSPAPAVTLAGSGSISTLTATDLAAVTPTTAPVYTDVTPPVADPAPGSTPTI